MPSFIPDGLAVPAVHTAASFTSFQGLIQGTSQELSLTILFKSSAPSHILPPASCLFFHISCTSNHYGTPLPPLFSVFSVFLNRLNSPVLSRACLPSEVFPLWSSLRGLPSMVLPPWSSIHGLPSVVFPLWSILAGGRGCLSEHDLYRLCWQKNHKFQTSLGYTSILLSEGR